MMHKWTEKEKAFLSDNYLTMSHEEIAVALGRTRSQVKNAAKRYKISGKRVTFTDAEIETVKRLYATIDTPVLAEQMGRKVGSIYNVANRLGLKKDADFMKDQLRRLSKTLQESGKSHRYPKGHVPANKGLRRPGYSVGRMRETQFKKGLKVHNYLPVGTVNFDTSGYKKIKIADPNKWEYVHLREWQDHNGPIPKGMNIVFKDGNKANTDLSNLEMITDAELMSRNTLHNYPEPVKSQIHALAGFKRRLNSYAKKQNRRSAE